MIPRIVALVALVTSLLAGQEDRGRPIVLLVHGRGMSDRDTAATRKMWQQALASGARTLTSESLIGDRDVRVVWYADVLDPRLSLIHISEPTRLLSISYAVFCLK